MKRLRAVLNPAPTAGRGPRLMAVGLAGLIAALTGAGSLAVAGEREAVIRMAAPPATVQGGEAPRTVELGAGSSALLNGEPIPEGLPLWAVAAERIDVRTQPAGSGQVNLILAFTGSTPVSVNGRRMPEGFPASGINGDAVERVDVVGDHVLYTLKPEPEVRLARRDAAAASSQRTARFAESDFAARLSNASAADYQLFCAAAEGTMDRMACSMLLWDAASAEQSAATPAFCAPNRTNADLEIIAGRGRAVALTGPAGRGSARDAARRTMVDAFPCEGELRAVPAEAVARASESLGAEWQQRYGVNARAESAARRDAYTAATGADYQRMCASQDPGEYGFCAGVLFRVEMAEARSASPAFCAPDQDDQAGTARFVSGAKAGVAQVRVSAGQSPEDVARAGLVRAYPCRAASRAASNISPPAKDGPEIIRADNGLRITPVDAVNVALVQTNEVQTGPAPRPTAAPTRPAESDFLAARRAERAATREAWPSERGLRLPGWPRPDRPAPGSPFYNERVASDPQNARAPRT